LTNLETSRKKLLQVILIGQPELRETLQRADLRQLAQRITARYHLAPLSSDEVSQYIHHRLTVSGQPLPLFSGRVLKQVYRISQGVPRLINLICDRALLGTYAEGGDRVTLPILKRAAAEVLGEALPGSDAERHGTRLRILILLLLLTIGLWVLAGPGWLKSW
jgi:general secretion pathway protein A